MPNGEQRGVVGAPINRVDGRLKVTGSARYSAEIPAPDIAYGVIVQSEIARGISEEIQAALGMAGAEPAAVFAELRGRKDRF